MRNITKAGLVTLLSSALFGIGASTALALPPNPPDPPDPPDCPAGQHPVRSGVYGWMCVPDRPTPPAPPVNNPFGSLDLVRQTTGKDQVHVVGWAADRDTPTSPIDVRVSVAGPTQTVSANVTRDDVAASLPGLGSVHGFDVTLPETGDDVTVCATAVNVGSGSDQSLGCTRMDWVTKFVGHDLDYDVDHAVIGTPTSLNLYSTKLNNKTSSPAPLDLSSGKSVQETSTWKNTQHVGAELTTEFDGKGSFLFISADSKVSVKLDGSLQWEQSGSVQTTDSWTWTYRQTVPAWRLFKASVAVDENKIDCPYVMSGDFVYNSGTQVSGTETGMYSGAATHDLAITVTEYYNNGKPVPAPSNALAAKPKPKPRSKVVHPTHFVHDVHFK